MGFLPVPAPQKTRGDGSSDKERKDSTGREVTGAGNTRKGVILTQQNMYLGNQLTISQIMLIPRMMVIPRMFSSKY